MRHIFIVNPAAGRTDSSEALCQQIRREAADLPYEIHLTTHSGHARELADTLSARYAPEPCRFYACGGDGTLSEVTGGALGHENAQVACIPCGTGNDFVKLFTPRSAFLDVGAQLRGSGVTLDVLDVNGHCSLNICNSGIDARVAHWVHHNKRKLPFSGIFPYITALVITFFRPLNRFYTIELDGERRQGEYAIIVAANGRCYGGGFQAVPEAEPDDGLMDLLLVPRISRINLLRCIGRFASGRHAECPRFIHHCRAACLRFITPSPEPLCCDGEISLTSDVTIRLRRHALRFVLPEGAAITHA